MNFKVAGVRIGDDLINGRLLRYSGFRNCDMGKIANKKRFKDRF